MKKIVISFLSLGMMLNVAAQDMDNLVENPSFENCKRCPVMDCKVRQKYRNVIEVDI